MLSLIKRAVKFPIRFYYTAKIKLQCDDYGQKLRVNGKSSVTRKTILRDNVNFNGMKITGGGEVKIGNNFHSGTGCIMLTSMHNYRGSKIPYDETFIHKNITIEDNVWIGINVIVLGGVTIGEGAIVQAGSVVAGSIPPLSIAGGHPAEVFKQRDAEHYNDLKEKNLFF